MTNASKRPKSPSKPDRFRAAYLLPPKQEVLDNALEETFPASDAVSITISKIVRVEGVAEGID